MYATGCAGARSRCSRGGAWPARPYVPGAGARTGPSRPARGDAGCGAPVRLPAEDRTEVVRRLKVDPALRFSETGRTLLRLLSIHTISAEEWDDDHGEHSAALQRHRRRTGP
ncbi:hypothetical protein SRIMM317S_04872 [Streptomyces rimosus subsp. rimosus]